MVSDVMDELKDVASALQDYADLNDEQVRSNMDSLTGIFEPRPLLRLRTGELVTEAELDRRCEEQRRAAEDQRMRGMHPIMLIVDEASALDPLF